MKRVPMSEDSTTCTENYMETTNGDAWYKSLREKNMGL